LPIIAKILEKELGESKKDARSYGEIKQPVLEYYQKIKDKPKSIGVASLMGLVSKIPNEKERNIVLDTIQTSNASGQLSYLNEIINLSGLTGTYYVISEEPNKKMGQD
jgi:hypothetical protein